MEETTTNNKENQAQKIVQEDTDEIVDVTEIQRIVMLYLGREANEQEVQRFNGIHESELKILTDYCNEEKTKMQDENKTAEDTSKIQGDLANKEMKMRGDNVLQQMKQQPAMGTAGGMPVNMNGPQMPPTEGSAPIGNIAPEMSSGKKIVQDGRFFPVQFS